MQAAILALLWSAPPPCTKETRGALWPAVQKPSPCYAVSICTATFYGPRWRTIGLPYWQLARQAAPASCRAGS